MAIIAEGLGRVASGIAMDRQNRAELAKQIRHATASRRMEMRTLLEHMRGARAKSAPEMAANLRKATMRRRAEVRSMMNGLRQSRERETREYHDKAKAFMRDLTNGVAGMIAKFAKEDHERAAMLHEKFVAYGHDRMEATAIWQGKPMRRQGGGHPSQHSSPMTAPAANSRHDANASHQASGHHAPEASGASHEAASRRHPFPSSSHRESSERKGSK